MRAFNVRVVLATSLMALPMSVFANEDMAERMATLEKQVEVLTAELKAMQQQRREQDKQLEIITRESVGITHQVGQEKISKSEGKGATNGTPVLATFKDGITFEDGTGIWKLGINGRVQADYRQFSPDENAADTFSLRRARLGATLTFYKDYTVRVEGEYAGGNTSLTYGYIDINKFQVARLRIGQFKPAYGLERSMSTNFTDFQERSMADALLGNSFDRGLMLFGSPISGINYSVAYVNGTGTVDETDVEADSQDAMARLTANVAEFAGWKDAVVHVGGFYSSGRQGSGRQANFIPTIQTEGRGLQFFRTNCAASACGSMTMGGFAEDVERMRGGYETALAYGSAKLQGEYILTSFRGADFERDMHAWYASALWNITGENFADMYKEGIFGRLKPKNNLKEDGRGWGAFQLGLRYSRFDGRDFKRGNAAGTGVLLSSASSTADGLLVATNKADAWTLGLNWILNPNVRLITNYVRTRFDTPVLVRVDGVNERLDQEEALTMRAQFDF